MGFFIFLFVALSLLNIIFPKAGWYMRYGWTFKGNVEPSDAYLLMTRITSAVVLVIFIIIISSW
ncbi:hypothetical protein E0485_22345 [Paenibacillus albiflavus]|uniref:DUF6199 domain-containing protein n=1 Tax=Paenibacillus albiflavus TaxID=2545760 RepID=A0A4R4E1U4_9BACL|nr:DUF6199 family natural product biosynthesis protein [Paenibacillus albiflavus]TCZ72328.1 hypothetical protein E0485_22345 [Paenibacillus albiflavus]